MNLPVTMALGTYEHVRDLVDGRVVVAGVDLNVMELPTLEVFHRFTSKPEFDVGEMSFGRYIALASRGQAETVALPVFLSRVFRIGSIYVRRDGPVGDGRALGGKRIGVPEWAQTATIYMRGWLEHAAGVDLGSVRWFIGGLNAPHAFEDQVPADVPPALTVERVTDRALSDLLVEGELDAIFTAGPPRHFLEGDPRVVRLFPNYHAEEVRYYRETGIFPIMHVLGMRRALAEQHPWLPMNLVRAFEAAKQNSLARMRIPGIATYAIPWHHVSVEDAEALFGRDFWPYGVGANRTTLEAFALYAFEQGVAARRMPIEELFAPTAQDLTTFYTAIGPPQRA